MNIQINNSLGIRYSYPSPKYISYSNFSTPLNNRLESDTFEKKSCPVFEGKKTNKKESKKIEDILKNIDELHDPYSDVIMISARRFKNFKNKIHRSSSAESNINILAGYKEHMFPSEKEVYELLKNETQKAKRDGYVSAITFTDILQEHYPEAKNRLKNEQFEVISSIAKLAEGKLNDEDREYVDLYLSIIKKDIKNDSFRIKSSRELLRRLENEISDKETAKEIIKLTKKFPNTATSPDAFIVKNVNKTQEQIAELLISPAQISIEHIKPSSVHGQSKGENYLAASRRMNNYRSSLPLSELIEEYPDIPQQTQKYFDDLILRINRGGLNDIALTLPDVRDTLFKESEGLINVDISDIKPEILKKSTDFKHKMNELVEHYKGKD